MDKHKHLIMSINSVIMWSRLSLAAGIYSLLYCRSLRDHTLKCNSLLVS